MAGEIKGPGRHSVSQAETSSPALKEIFDRSRLDFFATTLKSIEPRFDDARFLDHCTRDLETLGIMQRLRRIAEGFGLALPGGYADQLDPLRELAPHIQHGFAAITLAEFVALHGLDQPDLSLEALRHFTRFGSSEFAIRHFLHRDLAGTLKIMESWAEDENYHVRRLASEGSRPRLPWSFQLKPIIADPSLTSGILARLNRDPHLYVRKSVANHLNDITKDNAAYALETLGRWDREPPHTAWIVNHALRSLIKKGNLQALALVGVRSSTPVRLADFRVTPEALSLGDTLQLTARIVSEAQARERMVVDYAIHYVRKTGEASRKVFKLKSFHLAPGESAELSIAQTIRDFSTRKHYPGPHKIELLVNGATLGETVFLLR
ncbi:MAG: DNA alkylation repair protein [Rhizobiales bacterium 63-7]|nr:DNA alkylation repair protein [Hyphomicrobiales bacterium]OJU71891.1 MAG: DNA alkylation repair protein [Rhizobiales bacterium 63-7]